MNIVFHQNSVYIRWFINIKSIEYVLIFLLIIRIKNQCMFLRCAIYKLRVSYWPIYWTIGKYTCDCFIWMYALNISTIPITLSFFDLLQSMQWIPGSSISKEKQKKYIVRSFFHVWTYIRILLQNGIYTIFLHIVYMRKHKYGSLGINVCSSLQLVIYSYEGKY